ncbi:hypothetical protein PMZ80_003012 [Knufia obscura]|uniref:CENP-S associating centromere protein X-domain-containing protein n=1 Tax=Knufia obscura TaxID=1635080 RepID=A0ABR0S0D9_9EURO|nr:hypothetical protein PMZ80_003012 [Knufia obscura]
MAPTKRARPSFSPPRPKSKSKATNVSTAMKGRETSWKNQRNAAVAKKRANGTGTSSKYSGKKGTRRAQLDEDGDDDEEEEEAEVDDEADEEDTRERSALALVDASAEEDDEEEEGDSDSTLCSTTNTNTIHNRSRPNPNITSSPEPDMILAEITTTPSTSDSPIPEQLVHKILNSRFETPGKTKISADARDLVGRYLEVFVREAVMRSAFEREGREGGEVGDGAGRGGGFLEVEDLERVGVQLCLDF